MEGDGWDAVYTPENVIQSGENRKLFDNNTGATVPWVRNTEFVTSGKF